VNGPTVCQQAANAILRDFDEVPYPVRAELGLSMMATRAGQDYGFLPTLGLYLTHYGAHPADSPLVRRYLTADIADAVESGEAGAVIGDLGTDEPWSTVRRALEFAIAGSVTDQDHDRFAGKTDPRVEVA
jgi:hypothetical protein